MPSCTLHPDCHLQHDSLDSDDIGFPPIRVHVSTPVSCFSLPSSPNYKSSHRRRWSLSKQDTLPNVSPQLSRSQQPMEGLGDKNVVNTVRITVHQAKVLTTFQILASPPNQRLVGHSQFCSKAKSRHCRSSPFETAVSLHWRWCRLHQARNWRHQTRHAGNCRLYESRLSQGRS